MHPANPTPLAHGMLEMPKAKDGQISICREHGVYVLLIQVVCTRVHVL